MDFDVFVPMTEINSITKSKDNEVNYVVSGLASTPDQDFDGETILPEGLDISYLINNGWIDYEHDYNKIVGYPLADGTYVDEEGLHLKAVLFGDNPDVQNFIKLYNNISKDDRANRTLGFSIEGFVLSRDTLDESIINRMQINGVAITARPCNEHATITEWGVLAKSMNHMLEQQKSHKVKKSEPLTAGASDSPANAEDGGALRTYDFIKDAVRVADYFDAWHKDNADIQDIAERIADTISNDEKLKDNHTLATILLQLFTGVSANTALELLNYDEIDNSNMQKDLDEEADSLN